MQSKKKRRSKIEMKMMRMMNVEFIVNTMSDSNLRLQVNEQADYMTFDLRDEDHFEHDEDDYFD
jgi:hypothetical protein